MIVTPYLTMKVSLSGDEVVEFLQALKERKDKLETEYEVYSKEPAFHKLDAKAQYERARPMNAVRRMYENYKYALEHNEEVKS